MGKVVVAGSINTDITAYITKFPREGETVSGDSVIFGTGGKGCNQATAARRAGAEVIFIGKLGKDFLSGIPLAHLRGEGMDTDFIVKSDSDSTGCALIEVQKTDGQNRIAVVPGANRTIEACDIYAAKDNFKDGVFLAQFEISDEALFEACRLAKEGGMPTVINPAPARKIPTEIFDGIDYVTPNETEVEFYTGIKIRGSEDRENMNKAADVFFALGVKNVIITLGKGGSYFNDGAREIIIRAGNVKAVDTTGAGDAYNGGFAAALSEGMNVIDALFFATATAALSVTRKGAAASMAKRDEIETHLAELKKAIYMNLD